MILIFIPVNRYLPSLKEPKTKFKNPSRSSRKVALPASRFLAWNVKCIFLISINIITFTWKIFHIKFYKLPGLCKTNFCKWQINISLSEIFCRFKLPKKIQIKEVQEYIPEPRRVKTNQLQKFFFFLKSALRAELEPANSGLPSHFPNR